MLVLSLKRCYTSNPAGSGNEYIRIDTSDGPIEIRVVGESRDGYQKRIGIDAPRCCRVLRGEVIARMAAAADEANQSAADGITDAEIDQAANSVARI